MVKKKWGVVKTKIGDMDGFGGERVSDATYGRHDIEGKKMGRELKSKERKQVAKRMQGTTSEKGEKSGQKRTES